MFLITHLGVYSQNVYFKTGVNQTKYNYTSSLGEVSKVIHADLGNAYEIGYSFPFRKESRFSFDVGVGLNEYNSIVGVPYSTIKWKTAYAGLQSSAGFSVIKSNYFSLGIKAGFNVSTILYGKEDINGILYDIKKEHDFNGALLQSLFGLQANVYASKYCSLSVGYNYSQSLSTAKYPQNFSIETNQIMFGAHFQILKSEKNIFKK